LHPSSGGGPGGEAVIEGNLIREDDVIPANRAIS
jgi:hypothetical protein